VYKSLVRLQSAGEKERGPQREQKKGIEINRLRILQPVEGERKEKREKKKEEEKGGEAKFETRRSFWSQLGREDKHGAQLHYRGLKHNSL